MRRALLATLVLGAFSGGALAANTNGNGPIDGLAETTGSVARSGTSAVGNPMTSQQRGDYARDFVRKWGPYFHSTYKQSIEGWAQKEARIIGTADPANLRSAMDKSTMEAAMMALRGHQVSDDHAIDFLARQPASKTGQMPASLGDLAKDLVYTAVTPCRIIDTRVTGMPVGGGLRRSFYTYPTGAGTGFGSQGGKENTDCGMIPDAAAVAINVATPLPQESGFLTVYPSDTYAPLASNLDYSAGELKNNEMAVKIGTGTWDITIYAHGTTHVVADVVGYYAAPEATAVQCSTFVESFSVPPVSEHTIHMSCPTGYTATGGAGYWLYNAAVGRNLSFPNDTGWQAYGQNTGLVAQELRGRIRCCRVPGR